MVSTKQVKIKQSYDVCESETIIENVKYRDYGITMRQTSNGDVLTVVSFEGISVDKNVVLSLIDRLEGEDVDPDTLAYIVEDYITEISLV